MEYNDLPNCDLHHLFVPTVCRSYSIILRFVVADVHIDSAISDKNWTNECTINHSMTLQTLIPI